MSWPVIMSGVVCVATLALGFQLAPTAGQWFGDCVPFNRRRVRYGIFRPCGRRVAESVNATRISPDRSGGRRARKPRRCALEQDRRRGEKHRSGVEEEAVT